MKIDAYGQKWRSRPKRAHVGFFCGSWCNVLRNQTVKNLTADNICDSNFGYEKFTLEKCLNDVAELELKKFELWGQAPYMHVDHTDTAEITKMKKDLADRDIELACYTPEQCSYPINIADEDDTLRAAGLKFFKRAAETSAELNCLIVFMLGRWGAVRSFQG